MLPSPIRYLSVKQFSERAPISESTLRRRIESREIPSIQPGGPGTKILIPDTALDLLLSTLPEASGQVRQETVVNLADAPDFISTEASSTPLPRRGPLPRWQRNSSR